MFKAITRLRCGSPTILFQIATTLFWAGSRAAIDKQYQVVYQVSHIIVWFLQYILNWQMRPGAT